MSAERSLHRIYPGPEDLGTVYLPGTWIYFDGVGYVDLSNPAALRITGAISVFTWFVAGDQADGRALASKWNTATERAWFLGTVAGGGGGLNKLQVMLSDDGTYHAGHLIHLRSSAEVLVDGALHCAGFTFDPTTSAAVLYLDGRPLEVDEVYTDAITALHESTADVRWHDTDTGGNEFEGAGAHLSIWDRALTGAEVHELTGRGVPPDLSLHSRAADLVAWLPVTGSTHPTIDDEAGANDGTCVGLVAGDLAAGPCSVPYPVRLTGADLDPCPLPVLASRFADALDTLGAPGSWNVTLGTGYGIRVQHSGGVLSWTAAGPPAPPGEPPAPGSWSDLWGIPDTVDGAAALGTEWSAALSPMFGIRVSLPILMLQRVVQTRPGVRPYAAHLGAHTERKVELFGNPDDRPVYARAFRREWILYTDGEPDPWAWDNLKGWILLRPLEGRPRPVRPMVPDVGTGLAVEGRFVDVNAEDPAA